jgi:hypothetical protein
LTLPGGMTFHSKFIALFLLALCGCAGIDVRQYAGNIPKFDLYQYFLGATTGWGIVLDRSGRLTRQHSPEGIAKLRKEIDMLHAAYRDVQKGDSYYLCYAAPQRLTTLTLNDTALVAVPSKEFAEAYFGIWLGAVQPIDEKLRDRLLSGSGKNLAAK